MCVLRVLYVTMKWDTLTNIFREECLKVDAEQSNQVEGGKSIHGGSSTKPPEGRL